MDTNEFRSLQEAYLEVVNGQQLDEAMSSYDRNRKRAAQRAAERNAARAAGKTGVVPGVGYVSPRRERETYTDEKGTVRHKSGAKMEEVEMDEAMRPGERQRKMAAKRHDPYATSRDRGTAHNVAVRNDGPGTPGYEKKSTGGKGARFAGYGDRGAGNKARRRMGQEPLRGNTRKEEVDIYDIILSHLLDEGYADTVESAEGIMLNMSEEWRDSIVEADSLAAMQARREKRLAAQRKREGTTASGRDFGHDYSLTPAQQKARRDAEFKSGIGTKK